MLASTRSVIVDEIHALAPNKRGVHLALSLERLDALAGRRLTRIGLSATQKPIEEVARFLVGAPRVHADGAAECIVIDSGHARDRDLALEVPAAPLEAVMSGEVWQQIYDRLAALIGEHRTTLVFVNTRRMAERVARHLSERIGAESVTAHHGSMAREAAAGRRAAAQARRTAGAGGDRLAGAGHRHRRGGSGLPARLAALDRSFPAARRPLRPCGGRHAEGAAVPAVARRSGRNAPRCSTACAAANSTCCASPRRRWTCWRSRSWPRWRPGNGARRRSTTACAAPGPTAIWHAPSTTRSCACWPKATPRAAAGAAPCSTTTPWPACCAHGAARG